MTTASAAEQAKARDLSLELLADSILKGEFDRSGRSKILFLHSRVTGLGGVPCRLERKAFERQFGYAGAMTPATPLPLEVLARCWLPRQLARQWIEAHGYRWPSHLDPERPLALFPKETTLPSPLKDAVAAIRDSAPDRAGSRKPVMPRPSRLKPFWPHARKAAFEWFDDKGFPNSGDGGQAKLEKHIAGWLAERGHTASESIIRRHVKAWIEEYKASLSTPE
jgi:hypothetical protein